MFRGGFEIICIFQLCVHYLLAAEESVSFLAMVTVELSL